MVVCIAGPPIPVPLFPVGMLEDIALTLGPAMPLCPPTQVAGGSRKDTLISLNMFHKLMHRIAGYKVSKHTHIDHALHTIANQVIHVFLANTNRPKAQRLVTSKMPKYVTTSTIKKYYAARNNPIEYDVLMLQADMSHFLESFVASAVDIKRRYVSDVFQKLNESP